MKQLVVVGDRVLIRPEEGEGRSKVGLYLPPTAVDNQAVQAGIVVAKGPGTPISAPTDLDDEPWRIAGGGGDHVRGRDVPGRAPGGDPGAGTRRRDGVPGLAREVQVAPAGAPDEETAPPLRGRPASGGPCRNTKTI